MKTVLLAILLLSSTAFADLSGGGLIDYYGNGVTSQTYSGARNSLDVETVVSGVVVDPRARTWTLLNSTDSVNSVQSGAWTTGRTWTLSNATDSIAAAQSGTWTVQQGTPPWSVSQSGSWTTGRTWTLASGTDSTTVVQGTSPWVGNITQFGSVNLSTGVGASGTGIPRVTVANDSNILATQSGSWTVTANAGTNLNTSALALSANQTNGTQKTQVVDGSGNVQPSGDVLTRKIFVQPTDGSNNQGYTASNEAKVSVTQPIPAGSNIIGNVRIDQTTPGTTNGVVLNTGANVIGSLISNQSVNVNQVGGNTVNAGTGASGTGTQRVAVANDSTIKVWDGTTTETVKAASSLPAITDTALVITQRPDNYGTVVQSSVSCASTTTTLLAANTATMFLSIRNPTTATQTIWINVTNTAAVAAAPSVDIPPGGEAYFSADGASWLPSQQINCISGGTASTVTLVYR